MTTATCQHTNITFEAKSARAKNHPLVADLLTRANKSGQYAVVLDALREGREAGLTDIQDFVSLAESAMKSDRAAYAAKCAELRAEAKQRAREDAEYRQRQGWRGEADNQGELATEADEREVAAKMVSVRTSEF